VSLWKVADTQTQALMVDYYQRLLKGEGRSAALREVQKAMIANPATQHPYYWGRFRPHRQLGTSGGERVSSARVIFSEGPFRLLGPTCHDVYAASKP
jgi:hypothetical protein